MADEIKCVVCGQGSHREDWQGKTDPACDHHSKAEVASALTKSRKVTEMPKNPDPGSKPVADISPTTAESKPASTGPVSGGLASTGPVQAKPPVIPPK